jgi:hypothetical protein
MNVLMWSVLGALTVVVDARLSRADGCTKDTDCKGDRICDAGVCVEPRPAQTQTPTAPVETPPVPPTVADPLPAAVPVAVPAPALRTPAPTTPASIQGATAAITATSTPTTIDEPVPSTGWAGHIGGLVGVSYASSGDLSATDFVFGETSSIGKYVSSTDAGTLAAIALDHFHLFANDQFVRLGVFAGGVKYVPPSSKTAIMAGIGIAHLSSMTGKPSTGLGIATDVLLRQKPYRYGWLFTGDVTYVAGEANTPALWIAHIGVGIGVGR